MNTYRHSANMLAFVAGAFILASCSGEGGPTGPIMKPEQPEPLSVELMTGSHQYPDTSVFEVHAEVSGNPQRCIASGDWGGNKPTSGRTSTGVGPFNGWSEAEFVQSCIRGDEYASDTLRVKLLETRLDPPHNPGLSVGDSVIDNAESINIWWNGTSEQGLECTGKGSEAWSGEKDCTGGFETLGPFSGPEELEFSYDVCYRGTQLCSSHTMLVRVRASVIVGDFGVVLQRCDESTESCNVGDAQLPMQSGPYKHRLTAWGGIKVASLILFSEDNARNGSMGGAQFKLQDAFIGSNQRSDSVTIRGAISRPEIPYRRLFVGDAHSADSSATSPSCIAFGSLEPDCKPSDPLDFTANEIQVELILRDLRDGSIIEEGGTIERSSQCSEAGCYEWEVRVRATTGLHSLLVGTAEEQCNISEIGCNGLGEIFDRFENDFPSGETVVRGGISVAPNSDRTVWTVVASDGVNPPVINLMHLNIAHR